MHWPYTTNVVSFSAGNIKSLKKPCIYPPQMTRLMSETIDSIKKRLLVQDMYMGIELLVLPVAIQLALKLLSRLCKLLWIVYEVRPNPTRVYVYTLGSNSQGYWMVVLV